MAQTKGANCSYSMRIRTSCSQWPQAKGSNCGLASPPETSAQPLLSTESSGPALWGNLALVTLSSQLHQASVALTDEHEHLKPTIHPSDFPSPPPHTLRTPRQSFPSTVSMLGGLLLVPDLPTSPPNCSGSISTSMSLWREKACRPSPHIPEPRRLHLQSGHDSGAQLMMS